MSVKKSLKKPSSCLYLFLVCCFGIGILLTACGGSGGGGGDDGGDTDPPPITTAEWHKTALAEVGSDGISVRLVAQPEGDDTVHLAYYDNSGDDDYYGGIQYLKAQLNDTGAVVVDSFSNLDMVDNSATLDLALDSLGRPLVAYQGGDALTFCQGEQADVAVSLPAATAWETYTAAIGYVERNPAPQLQNGKGGTESAIVIDSSNNAHIVFTFRYEGCETVNHNYPDLRYVRVDGSNPVSEREDEETIHGNIYPEFNVVEENNSVGFHCDIVLDDQEQPLAFYAENKEVIGTSNGLHMAYQEGSPAEWTHEWIEVLEDDEEVVALSASVSAQDGTIGVAYAVDTEEDDLAYKMLKYAVRTGSGEWDIVVVDESASVGTYCSLTYNADGDPLIAYYAIQSHTGRRLENLKLARRTDTGWELETVAEAGNVGRDNTLWVDSTGAPHIVTYNDTTNEILHYVYR